MKAAVDMLSKMAAMPEEQQLTLARILSSVLRIIEQLPEDEIARRLDLLASLKLTKAGEATVKGH